VVKDKIVLRFSSQWVEQPVIYRLVKDFDLVVSILKADINLHREGFVVLELSGDSENYNRGLEFIKNIGVGVEPLSGSIVWHQERCLQCGACTTSCPAGALYLTRPDMNVHFDGSRCIVCESCLDVCMARAVEAHF